MICKNCGFEFDEGELCPTCGDELVDEAEATELSVPTEETPPEEEKIETSENAAQPEIANKNPSLKKLLIRLTAIICSVAILCTAAIGIFVKIAYDNLANRIDEAVLKGYEIGTKNGWIYGWEKGWGFGYNQALDDENYDDYENYTRYSKYFDNTESELEFPDGHLKLKEYSTTKDTLSADKEVCEVNFSFEIFNDSDEYITLSNITPSVYTMDSMLSSIAYDYDSFELIRESYPTNDDSEFEIHAKSSVVYEVTFMGPKADNVNVGIEFCNDNAEYIASANYYVEF